VKDRSLGRRRMSSSGSWRTTEASPSSGARHRSIAAAMRRLSVKDSGTSGSRVQFRCAGSAPSAVHKGGCRETLRAPRRTGHFAGRIQSRGLRRGDVPDEVMSWPSPLNSARGLMARPECRGQEAILPHPFDPRTATVSPALCQRNAPAGISTSVDGTNRRRRPEAWTRIVMPSTRGF